MKFVMHLWNWAYRQKSSQNPQHRSLPIIHYFMVLTCLTLVFDATAGSVSYNGYSLDTETNIVTGGGLQWLQWDETVGQSINTAIANNASAGWRLATNEEMANLFNSFSFGETFSSGESLRQHTPLYDDAYSFGTANKFVSLFGDTALASGNDYGEGDKLEGATAWYGNDQDEDGLFKLGSVQDEYTEFDTRGRVVHYPGHAFIREDDKPADTEWDNVGVALVRMVPLPAAGLRISLEEPVNGEAHSGIGNLRGWAIAEEGIDRVEIYIDGEYRYDAPFGGERTDVGDQYPDIVGSDNSGFSLAFGYSNLSIGEHTITVRAVDMLGEFEESTSVFEVVAFHKNFINKSDIVDVSDATISTIENEILLDNVSVDGQPYELRLKWRTAEQGFEIIEIN